MVKLNMFKPFLSKFWLVMPLLVGCATAPVDTRPANAPNQQVVPAEASVVGTSDAAPIASEGVPHIPVSTRTPDPALTPAQKTVFDQAITAMKNGQVEVAERQFAQIRTQVRNFVPAYLNTALMQRGRGKLDDALNTIDACLAVVTGDPRALSLKALILREQGKFAEAKASYLAAITSDPSYAPAHRNLAVLADVYLDEPALALRHMELYGQLMPNDKDVENWLIEMRRRVQASAPASNSP